MASFPSSIVDGPVPQSSKGTETSPLCPSCGSARIWKDGLRYVAIGSVQRWLCRSCGYRFSEPNSTKLNDKDTSEHHQRIHTNLLKSQPAYPLNRQICATQPKGAKNLATVEPQIGKAQGESTEAAEIVKGKLVEFAWWLKKEGYYEDTIYIKLLKRLSKRGANLLDPENFKEVLAKQSWKNSVKKLAVLAYNLFATQILKISWKPPTYKREETSPFVPEEKELDQLIAACRSKRMAVFLQTLKETYADPGEILKLRWIDIDFSNSIITINFPVKGHNAGKIKVSSKLLAMLNNLPRKSERVFPASYDTIHNCFVYTKKRIAMLLQNPRLASIQLRSFRHWGGSMLAHYTNGNVLTVQKMLRHKSILSSMMYIHMMVFKDDEFDVATATTVEEIKQLLMAGFEKADELNGIHIFKRPKRFNA